MRITFVTRKFGNVERNSHCDILHITPVRVVRLFLDCNDVFAIKAYDQCFMQDQNVACRRTCAWPSRNLASTRGDGKCRVNAHEIHTCLYNMTKI